MTKYILAPDKALAAKDSIAMALFKKYNKVKMPNLHLTPVDVKVFSIISINEPLPSHRPVIHPQTIQA